MRVKSLPGGESVSDKLKAKW